MIDALEVYADFVKDSANADQNGQITYAMFSRMSRRAEIRLLDWLSGDVSNERLPIPYVSQKSKDWLSPFIVKYPKHVVGGFIDKPADYYQWENFYKMGTGAVADCDDQDIDPEECNTPIELLDGQQFYERCNTYIEELKPENKPIAKLVGKRIEVCPKDLGTVELEYIKLPVFASITGKIDPVYNEEVPDVVVNYEWEEWARPFLIYFMVDMFTNKVTEQSGKTFNEASNPKR